MAEEERCASVAKERTIPNGVSVSRLRSGDYAVAVHDGDKHAIVDLTPDELADFIGQLSRLAAA